MASASERVRVILRQKSGGAAQQSNDNNNNIITIDFDQLSASSGDDTAPPSSRLRTVPHPILSAASTRSQSVPLQEGLPRNNAVKVPDFALRFDDWSRASRLQVGAIVAPKFRAFSLRPSTPPARSEPAAPRMVDIPVFRPVAHAHHAQPMHHVLRSPQGKAPVLPKASPKDTDAGSCRFSPKDHLTFFANPLSERSGGAADTRGPTMASPQAYLRQPLLHGLLGSADTTDVSADAPLRGAPERAALSGAVRELSTHRHDDAVKASDGESNFHEGYPDIRPKLSLRDEVPAHEDLTYVPGNWPRKESSCAPVQQQQQRAFAVMQQQQQQLDVGHYTNRHRFWNAFQDLQKRP